MRYPMKSLAVTMAAAAGGLLLSACGAARDASTDVGTSSAALVSDSAHGSGTPGFYFLPPIGSEMRYPGKFAAGLSPVVTVEEVSGRGVIATFTRGGRDDFRVKEEDRAYEAKWHVEHSGVKEGLVYRIHVSVNDVELGFADARVARTKAKQAEARRQGFVPLDGGELEIAFRVEPEALGSVSRTIGIDGGRVCAPNGACIVVPPGALDAPTTLNIEQTTLAAPAGLGAITPVYRLSPEGKVFAKPVQAILPVPAGTTASSVYWTAAGSSAQFDPVGGVVVGAFAYAANVHFSLVFAGAVSPTRTITGNRVITYITATTRADVFTAPTVAVEALVDDGAGGLLPIPGTFQTDAAGAPSGVFTIPGVPNGYYLLHVGSQFFFTRTNAPDLGYAVPGHLTPPMQVNTGSSLLDVSVSLGEPWQATDMLEFIGTENNMWDFNTERFTSLLPGDTATRFTVGLEEFNSALPSWNFQQPLAPCLPGTPTGIWCGDRLHFAHLSTRTSANGIPYQQISEYAQFAPFTTVTGGTQALAATLVPLPITKVVDVDFRGADFRAAIVRDGNPVAEFGPDSWTGGFFDIVGQPGLASDGFYSANADMALFNDDVGANVRSGAFSYGSADSFGGNWGEYGLARWMGRVRLALPGAKPMPIWRALPSGFEWTDSLANMTVPAVVEPKVTMPTGITVTGASGPLNFFDGGTGIGQSPVVTWSPPLVGVPDVYCLTGYILSVQPNGLTRYDRAWTIYTPFPRVKMIPGALQLGKTYVFTLAAQKKANQTAPFRTGLGDFSAGTPSGMFTP
jgi:hypothetical protein